MNLKTSDICKVLSVETRLKIIQLLKTQGPLGAKMIAESLGVTPAAISQHLRILSGIGLVRSERNGFFIPYSVDDAVLKQCRKLLSELCLCGCDQGQALPEPDFDSPSLEQLRKYEQQLLNRLENVRTKMKELELNS
jgi:DNA-binding transcriptional ArsR family regulator